MPRKKHSLIDYKYKDMEFKELIKIPNNQLKEEIIEKLTSIKLLVVMKQSGNINIDDKELYDNIIETIDYVRDLMAIVEAKNRAYKRKMYRRKKYNRGDRNNEEEA